MSDNNEPMPQAPEAGTVITPGAASESTPVQINSKPAAPGAPAKPVSEPVAVQAPAPEPVVTPEPTPAVTPSSEAAGHVDEEPHPKSGRKLIVVAVGVVLLVVVAAAVYFMTMAKPTTESASTTDKPDYSQLESADTKVDQELQAADASLTDIDQGLGDKQGDLSE